VSRSAAQLPAADIHMVGGPLPGEDALYESIRRDVALSPKPHLSRP